jgi:nucleoid-associated protein YgaU
MARRQLSVRLAVLIAAVSTVFLLIGGAADAEAPPTGTVEYVVAPGDTLWQIAQELSTPGDDLRRIIHDIRQTSGLDSSAIYPGQVLRVPQR